MTDRLKVLILEDDPADAELMARQLRASGLDIEWVRVETEEGFRAHLHPSLDLILADYHQPTFDALRALDVLKGFGLSVPLIVVTGVLGDDAAAWCIMRGASSYVLKRRLVLLGAMAVRAIEQTRSGSPSRRAQATPHETGQTGAARASARQREDLIMAHVYLAREVVSRTRIPTNATATQDDLMSGALLGLVDAVDNYSPSYGTHFPPFAVQRIRGAIVDMLRQLDWAPRSLRRGVRSMRSVGAALEQRLGRPPTHGELARELRMSDDEFGALMASMNQAVVLSLDAPTSTESEGDSAASLADFVITGDDPAGAAMALVEKEYLQEAVATLPDRDRRVVELYYYGNHTLKQIGADLGVTEARASQLHSRAVARLRKVLTEPMMAAMSEA